VYIALPRNHKFTSIIHELVMHVFESDLLQVDISTHHSEGTGKQHKITQEDQNVMDPWPEVNLSFAQVRLVEQ
jgi:hypothetical protein